MRHSIRQLLATALVCGVMTACGSDDAPPAEAAPADSAAADATASRPAEAQAGNPAPTASTATPAKSKNKASYAVCAACHLPDGKGIPGAFPPLRDRLHRIAALDGGREYLMANLAFGQMGSIEVDGQQYSGVMPGQLSVLRADGIAAALNYVIFELNDENPAEGTIEPFSADEVSAYLETVDNASPQLAGEIRSALIEQHGDAWP